jgi:hypothetical protein
MLSSEMITTAADLNYLSIIINIKGVSGSLNSYKIIKADWVNTKTPDIYNILGCLIKMGGLFSAITYDIDKYGYNWR